ncbi:MAG: hypothetical protein HYX33_02040 [Actinobacteria bacterium]|nr:hypothetical protein [Actinomycetota bacterium]
MDETDWPEGKRYEVQMFDPVECKHFTSEDEARAFWWATPPAREAIVRDLLANEVIEPKGA